MKQSFSRRRPDAMTPMQRTDILRTIRHSFSRFLAILIMTALGTTVFVGLKSTPPIMRASLESRIKEAHMEDLSISSPLGLDAEDRRRIEQSPGLQQFEYGYSGDFFLDQPNRVVRVLSLTESIDQPWITEGRRPAAENEVLLDEKAKDDGAYQLGDEIRLFPHEEAADTAEENDPSDLSSTSNPVEPKRLRRETFTIVGFARNIHYLSRFRGTSSVGTGTIDYFALVPASVFQQERPDTAYLVFDELAALDTFSTPYRDKERNLLDHYLQLFSDRPEALKQKLQSEAKEQIEEARDKLETGREELASRRQELEDARERLNSGWATYRTNADTYHERITQAQADLDAAEQTLADTRQTLLDHLQEYEKGLAQYREGVKQAEAGKETLEQTRQKLEDGEAALAEARRQLDEQGLSADTLPEKKAALDEGQKTLDAGRQQVEAARAQLPDRDQLEAQKATLAEQIEQGNAALSAAREKQAAEQAELDALRQDPAASPEQIAALEASIAALEEQIARGQALLATLQSSMDELERALQAHQQLDATTEQLDQQQAALTQAREALAKGEAALQTLDENEKTLQEGRAQYEQGQAAWEQGQRTLAASKAQLEEADTQLAQGKAAYDEGLAKWKEGTTQLAASREEGEEKLAQALRTLQDGEREYTEGEATFREEAPKAEQDLADGEAAIEEAQTDLDRIRIPSYTISGRHNDYTINTYFDQADSLDVLTYIFPTIFYLVALLVSLTTMMRMVDEERGQIGTLKALGYPRRAIRKKYLFYAAASSLLGALVGLLGGYFILSPVIFNAYSSQLYHFGAPVTVCQPLVALFAIALSLMVTTLATRVSANATLRERAAELMRPEPPAKGNRILLERIRPLWSRLRFMQKVTLRNVTAKKGRLLMTIFGIMGCSSLLIMGFGIQSSVSGTFSKQFENLQCYDLQIVYDHEADLTELEQILQREGAKETRALQTKGTFTNAKGIHEDVMITVPMDPETFSTFFRWQDRRSGQKETLDDTGALLTEKMAEGLNIAKHPVVTLRDSEGYEVHLPAKDEVENYFNHQAFLTPKLYTKTFQKQAEPNMMFVALPKAEHPRGEVSNALVEELLQTPGVVTVFRMSDTTNIAEDLIHSLLLIVFVIIVISSTLAFVVLFNLTNLNVSERMRELSTIKVLGFRSLEVTEYIYRETLLLTLLGIFFGGFLGKVIHYAICRALSPSMVMLDPALPWFVYLLSTGMTIAFSLAVMLFVHRRLKRVDMVEALKAVE